MIFSVQNKAYTSKRMEIRDVGLFILPQFIGSLIKNRSYRDSILNITCSVYCFCPEVLSHIGLIDHGSCHFLQSPILSLYNSILLWSSRTREIIGNTIFFEELLKEFVLKFATMITSDLYDFVLLLRLDLSAEFKEH